MAPCASPPEGRPVTRPWVLFFELKFRSCRTQSPGASELKSLRVYAEWMYAKSNTRHVSVKRMLTGLSLIEENWAGCSDRTRISDDSNLVQLQVEQTSRQIRLAGRPHTMNFNRYAQASDSDNAVPTEVPLKFVTPDRDSANFVLRFQVEQPEDHHAPAAT
jgi:hypothetical protein